MDGTSHTTLSHYLNFLAHFFPVNHARKKQSSVTYQLLTGEKKAQTAAAKEIFSVLSWSCLGATEGRCREEGGEEGGKGRWWRRCTKVGLPHKGNHWQKSRFTLCFLEPSMPGVSMHLCVSTLTGGLTQLPCNPCRKL